MTRRLADRAVTGVQRQAFRGIAPAHLSAARVKDLVTCRAPIELARLQLGVDYRISRDIAIAPVIGGSLSTFVSQDAPMTTDFTEIQDKKVNFTGFAGLSGRFDLGGTR